MRQLTLLLSLSSLTACASIVEGSSQNIMLQTSPSMQAQCSVANERGNWQAMAPGNVSIKRSKSDINVTCQNQQYAGKRTVSSDAESWTLGNLALGGLIGFGVDAGTGAMFSYEDTLIVPMSPRRAAQPTAHFPQTTRPAQTRQPTQAPAARQPAPLYQPGMQPRTLPLPAVPQQTY